MRFLRLASSLSFVSLALAWTVYTVPYSGGNDDAPTLNAALKSHPEYVTDVTILFKQGIKYNFKTPVRFPKLKNAIVSVQGNISYAADVAGTQAMVGNPGQSGYGGAWITFAGGNNITLEGSQDPHSGWVDSHGQSWWPSMQDDNKKVNRPVGWKFYNIVGGEIRYMKLWQSVAWSFIVDANNAYIHHNTLIARSNDPDIGHPIQHVSCFNIKGTNVLVEDNVIYNEDDCIVVCTPARNIHIRRNHCVGSNGLSITGTDLEGAVSDIRDVLFESCTIENALYGARYGGWPGGGGIVANVTWKDITMNRAKLPIYFDQSFNYGSSGSSTTNIKDFTYQNIHGTLDDSWGGFDVITLRTVPGTVAGIHTKNINVKPLSGKSPTVVCDPSEVKDPATGVVPDMGFVCANGPFTPTSAGK